MQALREECEEGRNMGFDAKQTIHPAQISTVQAVYSPSTKDIEQAQNILKQYEIAVKEGKGAYGLDGQMMDAPMILQAQRVLAKAKLYNLA